uniref:Uncharacterized protein n=1 Tax=Arundo donax TaxID=35708 RepID=A0A0A9GI94_ARUDO
MPSPGLLLQETLDEFCKLIITNHKDEISLQCTPKCIHLLLQERELS